MTNKQAKVTSTQALDDFRASLIVYLEKAGRILDEISGDVMRTRVWLQTDRQNHWKKQVHLKSRELAQAEQELLTARLSGMPEAIQARRLVVNKAKTALQDAQDSLDRVRHWIHRYETEVESRTKAVTEVRQTLASEMTKAVAFLQTAGDSLAAYADVSPMSSTLPKPAVPPVEDLEGSTTASAPRGENNARGGSS